MCVHHVFHMSTEKAIRSSASTPIQARRSRQEVEERLVQEIKEPAHVQKQLNTSPDGNIHEPIHSEMDINVNFFQVCIFDIILQILVFARKSEKYQRHLLPVAEISIFRVILHFVGTQ